MQKEKQEGNIFVEKFTFTNMALLKKRKFVKPVLILKMQPLQITVLYSTHSPASCLASPVFCPASPSHCLASPACYPGSADQSQGASVLYFASPFL
jgi:hypothetical protein